MRSGTKKVIAIALAGRLKGSEGEERRVERYRTGELTRKIVHQAEGVLEECRIFLGAGSATETIAGDSGNDPMAQVVGKPAQCFKGSPNITQIVSLFEPHTEIIRKGKSSSQRVGNMVKVQESREPDHTHYEVFAERPKDSQYLVSAVEQHSGGWAAPRMVAADAGFYSLKNEKIIQEWSEASRGAESQQQKRERRKLQKTRWFGPTALADRMRSPLAC